MSASATAKATPGVIFRSGETPYHHPDPFCRNEQHVTGDHYADALDAEGSCEGAPGAMSIYIHLPFCPSRCLSCDHNTTVTHETGEIDRYLDSLEREMGMVTGRIGRGRPLTQLHIGGGTPNYLTDPQLVRLAAIVENHFRIGPDTETSLDASPKRTSRAQLDLLQGLGFRRINFEVRDLDPGVQMAVGRSLSLPILQDVFDNARAAGFETLSTDLVYGLPGQTLDSIRRTLRQLVELEPDRVACFSYSRRPASFQHQRAIDAGSIPSLADKMAMFNAVVEAMQAADYTWIGLDCFVRREDALSSAQLQRRLHRNWIGYTLHESRELLGFGTNAVSELKNLCVQNQLLIPNWKDAIRGGSLPVRGGMRLSDTDRERRNAMIDLMCNMELQDYAALTDASGESPTLAHLQRDGLVDISADRVAVTSHGRYMLHQIWGDSSPGHRWDGVW